MSIPVFGDVTMVLISPLTAIISKRQHKPMGLMSSMTILSLNLTHSMVPPTPGILAVAVLLGADLGWVIVWGVVCSFIAYILTWLLMRKWAAKDAFDRSPNMLKASKRSPATIIAISSSKKIICPVFSLLCPRSLLLLS